MKSSTAYATRPAWLRMTIIVSAVLFIAGAVMGLSPSLSPEDVNQGHLIRIMYAHVAVAWIGFLAVGVAAFWGAMFLWKNNRLHDVRAQAAAELALIYSLLTVIGGMTYSKPTLNTFWTWDAKLTLTALMVALMVGYFIVRALIDDPVRRGRISAVILLIVLISLPFNYLAAEWYRTLHPAKSISAEGVSMDSTMLITLLLNTVAAGVIFFALLSERIRVGNLLATRSIEKEQETTEPTGEFVHV